MRGVYKIEESLSDKYHGAGYALAAICKDKVIDIRYVRDVAPSIADELDGDHDEFFIRQWMQTQECGNVVRELQALGDVSIGMCSCWEFCEL